MDFGHGGAMVEPSRGSFVHFGRFGVVASLALGRSRGWQKKRSREAISHRELPPALQESRWVVCERCVPTNTASRP